MTRTEIPGGAFIKVCGITRREDALHALQHGATALGFVFWPNSPRAITPPAAREIVAALPAETTTVGVFVNETPERVRDVITTTGVTAVQLHGDEEPEAFDFLECLFLRSVTLDDLAQTSRGWPPDTTWLLDASDRVRRGGTGTRIDWSRAAGVARQHKVVLAGGLTALNVEDAIHTVQPFGVDVSSGVEASPGIKDFARMSLFLSNARRAFGRL